MASWTIENRLLSKCFLAVNDMATFKILNGLLGSIVGAVLVMEIVTTWSGLWMVAGHGFIVMTDLDKKCLVL